MSDPAFSTFASAGESAAGPVGWNVYFSGNGDDWAFHEFVPNEPGLAAEASRMADEVERHLEDGTL